MQTNTIPLSSPTRKAGSRTLSRSRLSKPRASGTAASWPSCRYVQPWYGQRSTFGQLPWPSRMRAARCRQTFESARSCPSLSRSTAIGSPAIVVVQNLPGSATSLTWQAKFHDFRNTSRISASYTSGDV